MKLPSLSLLLLIPTVASFEEVDYEIFDIQDEVIKEYGPESNFYTVLRIEQTTDAKIIEKAYRKLSLKYQYPSPSPLFCWLVWIAQTRILVPKPRRSLRDWATLARSYGASTNEHATTTF